MGLGADVYKNGVGMVLIKPNRTVSRRYIEYFHSPSTMGYVNPLHALTPPGHPVTFAAKPPIATMSFVPCGIRRCAVVQWATACVKTFPVGRSLVRFPAPICRHLSTFAN